MLNKLFNFGKKSNGYYLELDESQESTNGKVATVTKAVEQKLTSVKEVVEEKVASTKEAVEEVVVEAKAKSKTTKDQSKSTQTTTVKTNTTNSGASSWEEPFWVKAMYQKSSSNGKSADSEATFATDYLMPTTNGSRRRPGPSLNKFKEMANRAKTPS